VFPSIRYAGRLESDPLGTLPRGEGIIIDGVLSQIGGPPPPSTSRIRWGDYSSMNVDPGDGCTFWYTQQYVAATCLICGPREIGLWGTRIASFRFPSCKHDAH